MNLIGKTIPSFRAEAVQNGTITTLTHQDLIGHYSVLFFYPLDFTFVCPTEMHALQEQLEEFEKRNTRVYGISIDSVHTHSAWLNTPKSKGGISGVSYTLISDIHRSLSRAFHVFDEQEGVALRGTYILDSNGVIQHSSINNLPVGRNVAEIIRLIDAFKFVEENGDQVCPANWHGGATTLAPTTEGVEDYFTK